jgi:GPH family glycoside/pentoside/hexuronide:cation symporter
MKTRLRNVTYSVGNLGVSLFFNSVQAWLIFFYVDVVRLDARLVGLAFAISYGVWNAINDPLLGVLTDRTRTRWGRRVPWVAVSAPLAAVLFVLVWAPPLGGHPLANPQSLLLLLYFALAIALFDLANSAASVAYIALFPELFRTLEERTEVSVYRQVAAVIGSALGVAVMPLLVSAFSGGGGTLAGYRGAGIVLGIVGGLSFVVSLLGSREHSTPAAQAAMPLLKAFKATLVNRSFLTYMGADLMVCYIWSWLSAMVPFYCKYAIRASNSQTSLMLGVVFLSALLFYPLWRRVTLRIGSKAALTAAVTLFVVLLVPLAFVRSFTLAVAMMFAVGIAQSGTMLVREILLADVIDEDELATGKRREGSYFGVAAFIERLVMILIGGSTGLVLTLSGYNASAAEQPATVAIGIRAGMSLLPAAALAVFLVAMRFYPLGRRGVAQLQARLAQARAAGARRR